MKLRQLQCFRAVMLHKTMTRAAEAIGTSQPGASNLIATLEHEIGFKLFERKSGRLFPTPEAGYLIEVAERVVNDLELAERTASQIKEGKFGSLTIAALPGYGMTVLPRVLSTMRKGRPGVKFAIHTRSSQVVRTMFPSQQFDVAIVEPPIDQIASDHEAFRFECVCVLPDGHPLAVKKTICPRDLADEPFVSLYQGHTSTDQLSAAFAAAGVPWDPIAETQFFATNCELAALGTGVSVVDPITAEHFAGSDLVARSFSPSITHEVVLMFAPDKVPSVVAQDFARTLREVLAPYTVRSE